MRVVIRSAAREDILRQYQYYLVEKGAEAAAARFITSVRAAIAYVCSHPLIGTPKSFINPTLTGLRSWPVKGFPFMRIYYLVADDSLRIVRFLHGKRDLTPIMETETGE